jgi:hypothetical protein
VFPVFPVPRAPWFYAAAVEGIEDLGAQLERDRLGDPRLPQNAQVLAVEVSHAQLAKRELLIT